MATLPLYQTKAEKEAVFTNCTYCDSQAEVSGWLADIDAGRFSGQGMAFRGMTRASYKLYSSLQRKWIEQGLAASNPDHKDLVQGILDEGFQHGVQGTVLQSGELDDLAMLSYFQHHGCPTPLLDFTSDIRVAMYFASQEPKDKGNGGDLDEYFSVYVFHPQIIDAMNAGLAKAWIEYSPGQREEAARWFRSYEMNSLQDTLIFHTEWIQQVYGQGVVSLDTSERFRRQAGLFAMNNTADLPFPEAIHAFVDAGTNEAEERGTVRTWISSLNIHRKHVRVVREWLGKNEPPMTRDHLLPEREVLPWVEGVFDVVSQRLTGGKLV